MLIETLASSLAARLVQNHVGTLARDVSARATQAGLDRRRLTRVLDYIGANLEGDLTLARLAAVSCLSRFHFSRAFKAAVGRSPHHYVSAKRLELAKQLLGKGDQPLAHIALTLKFSCQANFTRAFREAAGQTPAQYRRSVGMITAEPAAKNDNSGGTDATVRSFRWCIYSLGYALGDEKERTCHCPSAIWRRHGGRRLPT